MIENNKPLMTEKERIALALNSDGKGLMIAIIIILKEIAMIIPSVMGVMKILLTLLVIITHLVISAIVMTS